MKPIIAKCPVCKELVVIYQYEEEPRLRDPATLAEIHPEIAEDE